MLPKCFRFMISFVCVCENSTSFFSNYSYLRLFLTLKQSQRLKHFLRSEVNKKDSGRRALAVFQVWGQCPFCYTQRFCSWAWRYGADSVFMAWSSVSCPELAGSLTGLQEGCSCCSILLGKPGFSSTLLDLFSIMRRRKTGYITVCIEYRQFSAKCWHSSCWI